MTTSPQVQPDQSSTVAWQKYFPLLLVAVAILTYIATLRFEFIYDDNQQVLANPLIRSWSGLPLLFKTDVWRFWNPGVVGNYWRPLFMTWLLLNFKMFGLNPLGWHLTSVLVHAGATYLAYLLARRLTHENFVAMSAALIFAVHPVHLETVTWVSGVTDSLMALFFFSSLLGFIEGWEMRRPAWHVVSVLLFACSLLCKEVAIVLPVLVGAYALTFPRDNESVGSRVLSVLPVLFFYIAVIGTYWIARHAALQGINHSRIQIGAGALLLTWPSLLWFYFSHLLWPLGLSIFYDQPPVFHADWAHVGVPLLAILVFSCVLIVAIPKENRKQSLFSALLLLLPLAPAFALPALVPTDYAHDRYLYLPCFGFALLLAFVLQRIRSASLHIGPLSARALATVVIVIALSAASSAQIIYWANDLLLFNRATQIAPGNVMAFDGLGRALLLRGRTREAMFAFEQVLKVEPDNWAALYNLGLNAFLHQDYARAESYLVRAAQSNRNDSDTFAVLADTLNHERRFTEAQAPIEHALALRPLKPGYRRILAESLDGQGKTTEAIEQLKIDLREHPDSSDSAALLQQLRKQGSFPTADDTAK